MRIQLDTDAKTIKLENTVKLSELFEKLEQILPNGEWKEFTLETHTIIERWSSPIIIHDHTPKTYPWWEGPYRPTYYSKTDPNIQLCNNSEKQIHQSYSLKSGLFNIEA